MSEALELLPPDDTWVLRARSEVPLWLAMPQRSRRPGARAAWTELPHAVFYPGPDVAVATSVRLAGPAWHEVLHVQAIADARLEYALWFAECWDEACALSQLDPAEALEMPAPQLFVAFREGVLQQRNLGHLRPMVRWVERALVLGRWACQVREGLHESMPGA